MTPRIKNCGLRTPDDVSVAIRSGASFLGFVIYPASPRHLDRRDAAALCRDLPSSISSVAVMVDPSDDDLQQILSVWRPDMIQLHGHESPERAHAIAHQSGCKIIKAIAVSNAHDIKAAATYQDIAHSVLFDTKHLDMPGGSGQSFDWELLRDIQLAVPWFLSGGLDVENIEAALRITRAPMVDVSSGIESRRGVKDSLKIIAFNEKVRRIIL